MAKKNVKKRVFISDVHMGPGREPLNGRHNYDWFNEPEITNFVDFLNYLKEDSNVAEIVLIGDIFDNWVCPIDEAPPTFEEIILAPKNKPVIDALKTLSKPDNGKKVVIMPGNHDMSVTENDIKNNFPGMVFGGSAANKSLFRSSRLLAEHGSTHAMFCAPDPINNPGNRLPLGFFISRIGATKEAMTGSSKRHIATGIDDLLECLGPQTLPQSVFEYMLEEAQLNENCEILMPSMSGIPSKVIASDIKTKYANLYQQWQDNFGKGMAFKAILSEIGYLGDWADHLCKRGDTNIVIFGHSHDSAFDKDSWFVADRIYANCGAWCGTKVYNYVETEKDEKNREHIVRLFEWKNKMRSLKKEDSVPL